MTRKLASLIIGIGVIVAAFASVHPSIQVSSDSVILNTDVSSSIIDGHGAAVALQAFSCGIDTTVWCDVADSMGAQS